MSWVASLVRSRSGLRSDEQRVKTIIEQLEALKFEAETHNGIEAVEMMLLWTRCQVDMRRIPDDLVEKTRGYMAKWEEDGRRFDAMMESFARGGKPQSGSTDQSK